MQPRNKMSTTTTATMMKQHEKSEKNCPLMVFYFNIYKNIRKLFFLLRLLAVQLFARMSESRLLILPQYPPRDLREPVRIH